MFSNTLDGYMDAKEFLQETGKLDDVCSKKLNGFELIAEANRLKQQELLLNKARANSFNPLYIIGYACKMLSSRLSRAGNKNAAGATFMYLQRFWS